jgi:glycosyltransferase involved in cell wall biosynthesis
VEIALLTGGQDRPYAFGLVMTLVSKGVCVDVIGSDEVDSSEFHSTPKVRFLNLRGKKQSGAGLAKKLGRLLMFYMRLIRYAAKAKPRIFHILWNSRFEYFDRTVLMLFYKVRRKIIVLTAHNVNAGKRDCRDTLFNRLTLRMQYRLADHIFVHTDKMKLELIGDYGVGQQAITVLTHPINDAFPDTDLTTAQAKQRLGIRGNERVILFFGRLRPYKGLEYLVAAFQHTLLRHKYYRLIIAGERKKGSEEYAERIQAMISDDVRGGRIISHIKFIPDEEAEVYFKAADLLVLPYKEIFQSGVLFLAYSFGVPVVVTDVGSFSEAVVEGKTGFVCRPCDASDLAHAVDRYFKSDLYENLDVHRREIRDYAHAKHSWDAVGELTRNVYTNLIGRQLP